MSKASRIPRVISVLLALSLLLSLLPGALAAEPQLTRAELATVLMRLDELVKGQNV